MTDFYREQAAREQNVANNDFLANVRERSQRAADAWSKLADRLESTDKLRAETRTADLTEELLTRSGVNSVSKQTSASPALAEKE